MLKSLLIVTDLSLMEITALSLIQVGFVHHGVAAAVIVYLGSDGSWSGEQCGRTATILLSDTTGMNHSLGMYYMYYSLCICMYTYCKYSNSSYCKFSI